MADDTYPRAVRKRKPLSPEQKEQKKANWRRAYHKDPAKFLARYRDPEKRKQTNKLRYATRERKARTLETVKQWALANPERYAEIRNLASIRFRLRKRGLTIEQFEKMLANQGYCCAICRSPTTGNKRNGKGAKLRLAEGWPTTAQQGDFTWHVDHDHKTGKVRGLLCHPCNAALGFVRDDPAILKRMIEYLMQEIKPNG